jgi:putative copper resistance protein D
VAVTRVLLAGAITATLGLNVVPLLFSPREQAETTSVRLGAYRAASWVALCWIVCAAASILLQTADLAGTWTITATALRTYVAGFGGGQVLVVEMVVAAIALGTAARGSRTGSTTAARILVLCAAAGLLLLVSGGHAGGLSQRWHDLAIVSLELHVFAAALWTGGLGAVVTLLSADRELLARALPRYSPLAGACLGVVAVSGLLNAVVELSARPSTAAPPGLLEALVSTDYGQLVLLKAGCLVALAGIGAHMRFRLLPSIREGRRARVVVWACCELAVMGVAFGLAAVLERSAA